MGMRRRSARTRGCEAGFTLLEMIIAGAISVIVGLALMTVYRATSNSVGTIYGQGTLQLYLNNTMAMIANDVRLANSAPVVGPDGTTLTISVPSFDGSRQPIPDPLNPSAYVVDTITYQLTSGSQLQRSVVLGAGSQRSSQTQILATNLNSTQFILTTPAGQVHPVVGVGISGHLYNNGMEITSGKVSVTLPVNGQIVARNL